MELVVSMQEAPRNAEAAGQQALEAARTVLQELRRCGTSG